MPALPNVLGDVGLWGTELNNYLLVAHNADGSLLGLAYNVKDGRFGARGDGITDDTAAIQAAITACQNGGGGVVYFPAATYLISSTLTVGADNIQLIGSGWGSQLLPKASFAASPMVQVLAPGGGGNFRYGFHMADLYVNANNLAGVNGIELDSTYHARLDRVRVRFCTGTSVFLSGNSGARGAYTHLVKCLISDGGAGTGILSNFAENNVVIGGLIAHFQSSGGLGIKWQDGVNLVLGTVFDNCDTALWSYFASANQVIGAQFTNGLTRFLYLNGAQKTFVKGCYFDAFLGSGSQDMIYVDNANNTVEGCICNFNTGWAHFIREAGASCLGNLYVNNQMNGLGVVLASGSTGILRSNSGYNPVQALPTPAAPAPTNAATGGTVLAGAYGVKVTLVNAFGETIASAAGSTTTTGSTSTLTIPAPTPVGNATGWYAYVTQANGATYTRQQTAGSPTQLGVSLTLTAPPSSGGATAPASNTAVGVTTPAVPATGVALQNTTGVDCTVVIATVGGLTAVAIGGLALTPAPVVGSTYRLPANQTIALTWATTAPTWQWIGE